jgi:hypothetical protein
MQLSHDECRLFYKLHPALMCYANQKLKTLPDQPADPAEFYALEPEKRVQVRDALHAKPDLIDQFVADNPFGLAPEELAIVRSWKRAVVGSFYIFRYLKGYTVFLSSQKVPKAYGVLALADPFEDLIGPYLPRLIQTVLLPFKGRIVYDGLLSGHNITFGGGIKRMLNEEYKKAKADFGIITSLPWASEIMEPAPAGSGAKTSGTFPLRLTQAQRRVIAGQLPDLRPRLHLDQPNQRDIQFTLGEMRSIASMCEQAVPQCSSGMERNSLRHVAAAAERAVEKFGKSKIHRISAGERVFQFRISLRGITPRIWRRIQTKDCTLDKLHEHIQTAMGWTNSHLHSFEIKGQLFGDPMLMEENFEEMGYEDSTTTKLSDILPKSGESFRFDYEYDFGDGWKHNVLFEGCLRAEKGTRYPLCLEGERACPPEDVGGIDGYQEYLAALADPKHEEHQSWMEWRGPFDPEKFDAEAATRAMRRGLPDWRNTKSGYDSG